MDDFQLKAALLDLAEFGCVYLKTLEDAQQVAEAAPVKTKIRHHIHRSINADYYWVYVNIEGED